MDKEQAIRKAQKLMAVAMDGRGNGHEAERALAQAETLMRKFGIEQAEIASTRAASDSVRRNTSTRASRCATRRRRTRAAWRVMELGLRNR